MPSSDEKSKGRISERKRELEASITHKLQIMLHIKGEQ